MLYSWGMHTFKSQSESFLPLRRAAVRLGVPVAWLRAEADAGRIPCLRVGRRLMVNQQTVEAALLARTTQAGG
ncbi:MAG: hypothetical protein WCI73_06100, partial [Phycisphaerae bacterium]